MANIKAEEAYDPFPKTGRVKQYEPFIRAFVWEFVQKYPTVSFEDALVEAVRIAVEAEPKFNPDLGYDFSTFLRHHLKGMHRELFKLAEEGKHLDRLKWASVANVDVEGLARTKAAAGPDDDVGDISDRAIAEIASIADPIRIPRYMPKAKSVEIADYLLQLYGQPNDCMTEALAADLRLILEEPPGATLAARAQAAIAWHDMKRREDGSSESLEPRPRAPKVSPKDERPLPVESTGPEPSAFIRNAADLALNLMGKQAKLELLDRAYASLHWRLTAECDVNGILILAWMKITRRFARTLADTAAILRISAPTATKIRRRLEIRLREEMLQLIIN